MMTKGLSLCLFSVVYILISSIQSIQQLGNVSLGAELLYDSIFPYVRFEIWKRLEQ